MAQDSNTYSALPLPPNAPVSYEGCEPDGPPTTAVSIMGLLITPPILFRQNRSKNPGGGDGHERGPSGKGKHRLAARQRHKVFIVQQEGERTQLLRPVFLGDMARYPQPTPTCWRGTYCEYEPRCLVSRLLGSSSPPPPRANNNARDAGDVSKWEVIVACTSHQQRISRAG